MTMSPTTDEEIEGIDGADDSGWGEYPIDTMLIRNEPRTVHDVLRRIKSGTYVMDPDFQRSFIWQEDKQSRLIESVLMRIPLPVFYLAETWDGKMVVVDGLQRLSTFENFVDKGLKLKLPERRDLHGKRFDDLPPKLQNRIEDCQLILYIIDSKVPQTALLDIFERVNGGVPLTRQQMRNCLFMGPATRFLRMEAQTDLFKEATGGSLKFETMRDREMINRFCGFTILGPSEYKGDMDDFLARTLERMNGFDDAKFKRLSAYLQTSLSNNQAIFGRHAFRKFYPGQTSRAVFNASLWDVMSTVLAKVPAEVAERNAEHIRDTVIDLMNSNGRFRDAITLGTNQENRVNDRFRILTDALKEYQNA